jgi:uncharacterized protein YqeY
VEKKQAELKVLHRFLPEPLTHEEIKAAIDLRLSTAVQGCKILEIRKK